MKFRCTRNAMYLNPDCAGHHDLSARQGYYIEAPGKRAAMMEMTRRYPEDGPVMIRLDDDHPWYGTCWTIDEWNE